MGAAYALPMRTIVGPGGRFRVSNASWAMVLRLALNHGWRPAGTEEPEGWSGQTHDGRPRLWNPRNYWARRGQGVAAEDAAALAAAVDAAMPDIPDHDAMAHKIATTIDLPRREPIRFIHPFRRFNPYEYFSGANKAKLGRFVEFCRAGGFTIN